MEPGVKPGVGMDRVEEGKTVVLSGLEPQSPCPQSVAVTVGLFQFNLLMSLNI